MEKSIATRKAPWESDVDSTPAKKARLNSANTSASGSYPRHLESEEAYLASRIGRVEAGHLPRILAAVFGAHPSAGTTFLAKLDEYEQHVEEREPSEAETSSEEEDEISFDYLVQEVEYVMNDKYKRLRPSQQFDRGSDILDDICSPIQQIKDECEGAYYGTKRNGINALIGIQNAIMDSRHGEMTKMMTGPEGCTYELYEAMKAIVMELDEGEANRFMEEGHLADLSDLEELMQGYGIEDVTEVLALHGVWDEDAQLS